MKKLNIFYFENNVGNFDKFNPRFVMEQENVKSILSLLIKKPCFFYTKNSLYKKISKISYQNFKDSLSFLTNISAITIKNNKIKINFPFFTSADLKTINKIISTQLSKNFSYLQTEIKKLGHEAQKIYPNIDYKTTLYHLLCGQIFDGTMFSYLEKINLLKESFSQPDNRDYLIVAYQNNNFSNNFNKELFCSFNNARFKGNNFSSFGNAFGERLDFFRYFKLREISRICGKFKIIDKSFEKMEKDEILKNSFEKIIELQNNTSPKKDIFTNNLIYMNYLNKDLSFKVPVFENYQENIDKLSNSVFAKLGNLVGESLMEIKKQVLKSNILCVNHMVDIDQLCNELYHIYFGKLNRFLIRKKIVAKPQLFLRQGSYLKCIYLSKTFSK